MSVRVVAPEVAEAMVPVKRSQGLHYGRGSQRLSEFFIMHSKDCLASGIDLATCPYSLVMANTNLLDHFEAEYVYLLRIEDGSLRGTRGVKASEIISADVEDAIWHSRAETDGACPQGIEDHYFCDCPPIDYGALAQRAAEDHIIGCWEALHGDREDDPAIGAFCGCTTCEVREILMVAVPHLEKAWEVEHGITD